MAAITFIENSPENILQETIAKYNELSGITLAPADSERLLIDVMAYRESLLRASMERAMRANFVQTAEATALDYWGGLLGVVREANQSDEAYRQTILSKSKNVAVGTRAYYTEKIKAISTVADLLLYTKQDDPTLPPGVTLLVLIEKTTWNNLTKGSVASRTLQQSITDTLSDQKNNLIGDVFVYESAKPIAINGSIQVRKNIGTSDNDVQTALNYRVEKYFGELSLHFSSQFGNFDLERELLQADGVKEVVNMNFVNVPVLREKEFYTKGSVTITIL